MTKKLDPADLQRLRIAYDAGATMGNLSIRFGMSVQAITDHLLEAGVALRLTAEMQELRDAYEAGATLQELAELFGISPSTARARLQRIGVAPRWQAAKVDVRDKLIAQDVKAAYEAGTSIKALAETHDVPVEVIRRHLVESGVVLRTVREAVIRRHYPGGVEQLEQEARSCTEEYLAGDSVEVLANRYGVTATIIYKRLKQGGIDPTVIGRQRNADARKISAAQLLREAGWTVLPPGETITIGLTPLETRALRAAYSSANDEPEGNSDPRKLFTALKRVHEKLHQAIWKD